MTGKKSTREKDVSDKNLTTIFISCHKKRVTTEVI